MLNLCLFGGGRWARVIASVLYEILPAGSSIHWVSRYNNNVLHSLLNNKFIDKEIHFKIHGDDKFLRSVHLDAAIVATSTTTHHSYVKKCLASGIPTLCEKPLSGSYELMLDLVNLSKEHESLLGVNYEFVYASFLYDFKKIIKDVNIKKIDIVWHDPVVESRYGENKYANFSTSIIYDQLSHCLSIVEFLCEPDASYQLVEVSYTKDSSVEVTSLHNGLELNFSLSRRAEKRTRCIKVNDEAFIDFSIEPGEIIYRDFSEKCAWSGLRPLAMSLKSFLEIVKDRKRVTEWPLEVNNLTEMHRFCAQCDAELQNEYNRLFDLVENKSINVNNKFFVDLVIDKYAPLIAEKGCYKMLTDYQTHIDFAKQCLRGECA